MDDKSAEIFFFDLNKLEKTESYFLPLHVVRGIIQIFKHRNGCLCALYNANKPPCGYVD